MADPLIPPITPVTTTPVAPVGAPIDTAAPATPVTVQVVPVNSSKSMLWVIVAAFLVVALLVGVGIYMYSQAREVNPAFQQISQSTQEALTSAENDLTGVTEENVEADFADVDKELNSL